MNSPRSIFVTCSTLFLALYLTSCSAKLDVNQRQQVSREISVSRSLTKITNQHRSSQNQSALKVDSTLTQIAMSHALNIAAKHQASKEKKDALNHLDFLKRVHLANTSGDFRISENVAWYAAVNPAAPGKALFKLLHDSESHRKNIYKPDWTHTGVATVIAKYDYYTVQVFGVVDKGSIFADPLFQASNIPFY